MGSEGHIEMINIIESYTNSAEFASLSLNTKRTYTHYLTKFTNYPNIVSVGQETSPTDTPMQIGVALQKDVALLSNVVLSFQGPQGQRMARRVLILLFAWAQRYHLVQTNPAVKVPLPKLTAKPRSPFTIEEVKKLESLLTDETFLTKLKPYVASALVAFHTGMRPSELENLVWDDVGEDFIQVRSAKHQEVGAVARLVKVTHGVAKVLHTRGKGLVFKSVTGKKLNKDTRSEAINYACTKVGIKPREFYSTRRGTATEMYKAGYDISAIQHQLGHRDIATTQIYIKPSMEQAASVFRGF